ncbi:unnamed protein product, partial [Ceratitis capitata]
WKYRKLIGYLSKRRDQTNRWQWKVTIANICQIDMKSRKMNKMKCIEVKCRAAAAAAEKERMASTCGNYKRVAMRKQLNCQRRHIGWRESALQTPALRLNS